MFPCSVLRRSQLLLSLKWTNIFQFTFVFSVISFYTIKKKNKGSHKPPKQKQYELDNFDKTHSFVLHILK